MAVRTEIRQRAAPCEPTCDANGNVPFCKSANNITSLSTTTNSHQTNGYANGTGLYGDGSLNDIQHMNQATSEGFAHAANGKVPIRGEVAGEIRWPDLAIGVKLLVTGAAGIVFGFVMEKGRVFEPQIIRGQMLFQNFVMLKMFLSGIVASLVCFSLLSLLPFASINFKSARSNAGCRTNRKGVKAAAIGGAMLGSGMAMSGACPGATLIEVGAGVQNAGMTFAGCLLGALLYGLTEERVNKLLKPKNEITFTKLDERLSLPYHKLALPLALVIGIILAVIEYLAPWRSELTSPNAEHVPEGAAGLFAIRSWPPILAGSIVGSLQLPIVLAVDEPIGGSRGYCTMVSRILPSSFLQGSSPYLRASRTGLRNWWQVVYISSAIAGAAASALSSGTWASTYGVAPLHALLGGTVMVYGSRLAGGCTSGHGLSGIGMLSLLSFVAIPSMFLGGITTAVAMTTTGVY
ncbi:uncharacterized protein [Diadema setosum]|uniref:uncharacterized protein n=1 Tax=Diadema setosum TaxID=31175 RepID=UPI003B3B3519